jgi:2-succinyl-5-enolpyruvyl-6-hydroxy-3-cyclohexene-1-carboxylate synthase
LVPIADGATAKLRRQFDQQQFFAHLAPSAQEKKALQKLTLPARRGGLRGLIVAGPANPENVTYYVTKVAALAAMLDWPVLADALSPVRHRARHDLPVVTAYDAILRAPKLAARLRPDVVICVDAWPTSKVLRGWLQATAAETWLVGTRRGNADGLHGRTRHLQRSLADLEIEAPAAPATWRRRWLRAEERARGGLFRRVDACDWAFEGRVAQLLPGLLPAGTPVFVASSMPVRDAEYFWPATERGHSLFFNRGANGIDGTLSTALGVAHGGRPAVLLTGDLALLHDANGFLLRPKLRGSLTVVLINNRGGGIFEHLPVAQFEPPFEEFFATPQEADFSRLCPAYGVEHIVVRDWAHFGELVAKLPTAGVRVLEVRTDRRRDAAFRKRLFAEVAAELG